MLFKFAKHRYGEFSSSSPRTDGTSAGLGSSWVCPGRAAGSPAAERQQALRGSSILHGPSFQVPAFSLPGVRYSKHSPMQSSRFHTRKHTHTHSHIHTHAYTHGVWLLVPGFESWTRHFRELLVPSSLKLSTSRSPSSLCPAHFPVGPSGQSTGRGSIRDLEEN